MQRKKKYNRIMNLAILMSSRNMNVWYICQKDGRDDILVSDRDINRFLQMGYRVESAYLNGKQYRNIYKLNGEIHFVK